MALSAVQVPRSQIIRDWSMNTTQLFDNLAHFQAHAVLLALDQIVALYHNGILRNFIVVSYVKNSLKCSRKRNFKDLKEAYMQKTEF